MNVPTKENMRIVPKFLKNGFFFILNPLSNIIGGKNKIMKRFTKWPFNYFIKSAAPIILSINPLSIPISVVRPAS